MLWAKTDTNKVSHHVLFAGILVLFLVLFFTIHHHFQNTCVILLAGTLDQVMALIRSWGLAAPLMSVLLMITQAIVAPLPAFLITAANGMIFGAFWGALISLIGALLGALTPFSISRLFGEVALNKIVSYLAGLSGIRLRTFIAGTVLGMLPATIVYSLVGDKIPVMEEHSPLFLTFTVVFIFILIVFSLVQSHRKGR